MTVPRQERGHSFGEAVTLRTEDGAKLCGELLLPPAGPPRAAVALSHAMMVDRRTMGMLSGLTPPTGQGLLPQLLAAGAAVLWFDLRGHGQSGPTPSQGARFSYDTLVRDAATVSAYLAERFSTLPRVAVGHSLFGHVALAHQARVSAGLSAPGFDRLALIATNVWLKELEPLAWRWWLKRVSFGALAAATRPLGYLPVRALMLGTADEPRPYLEQMASWLPGGDWCSHDGFSYLRALARVRTPLLSVAGAGDRLLGVPSCQLRMVSRTAGPITHITVGRHFGYACDPDHMGLVLDRRLLPLWREIAAWVCAIEPPQ